jgi:hypothetical protein
MLRPGTGRGGRALRNGVPQTGSGPDGSSPQRTTACAAGNLTVAPGTRPASSGRPLRGSPPGFERTAGAFSPTTGSGPMGQGEGGATDVIEKPFGARRCERSEDGDALPGLRKKRWPVRLPGGHGTRPGERRRRRGWARPGLGHLRPIARLGRHPPAVRAGLRRCVTTCRPAGHTSAVRSQRPCGARISRARPWPSRRDGHRWSRSLTGRANSSRR